METYSAPVGDIVTLETRLKERMGTLGSLVVSFTSAYAERDALDKFLDPGILTRNRLEDLLSKPDPEFFDAANDAARVMQDALDRSHGDVARAKGYLQDVRK